MAGIRTLAILAAVAAAGVVASAPSPAVAQDKPDWREQNAYTLGAQAYIYAFPWSYMAEARWTRSEPVGHQANRFDQVRKLEDASHLTGGAPNNDTLYSRAWVYLKDEPVILTVPAITDRYHSVEMADFMDDNFAYVGRRATGDDAGNFAIVGPGWKGTLPAGVTALPPSSTPWAFVLVRTYIKDASDLNAACAIQYKYGLTPLSQWGNAEVTTPKGAEIWQPLDRDADPLNEWRTINRAMLEIPARRARRGHASVLCPHRHRAGARCRRPGCQHEAGPGAGRRRRSQDHRRRVHGRIRADGGQRLELSAPATARLTPTRDWLMRAIQPAAGFVVNDPVEATYLNVSVDGDGKPLTGTTRYVIHFAKGGEPKVKAFWSVTMYNTKYNLVANPIGRYSIGDRSGMKPDADGGLTIYVQKDLPGADKESDWLPTPYGQFFMILRTYLPADDIVTQTWQPPKITAVGG